MRERSKMKTSKRKIKRPRPSYKGLYTRLRDRLISVDVQKEYCDSLARRKPYLYREEFNFCGIEYSREFFHQVYMLRELNRIKSNKVEDIIAAELGFSHSHLIKWVFSKMQLVAKVSHDTLYLGLELGGAMIEKAVQGVRRQEYTSLSLSTRELMSKLEFFEQEIELKKGSIKLLEEKQKALRKELGF